MTKKQAKLPSRQRVNFIQVQHLDYFLWKVILKILNSGINMKTFTHVFDYIKYRSKDGTGQNLWQMV